MATGSQLFYKLWREDAILEAFFEFLSKEDICNVRLASSACCNLVTKRLFLRTHLTFKANTFTRQDRIEALSRIGHHIEHLTFQFTHSDATFLPPLIHPETGREISFLYAPYTSMASVLERPQFANTELGVILTDQYPPLFHAASNVPSFINAMKHLPNMRHLTIKTPGQDSRERYRRDIVDYALISLRIAVERAPLNKLTKLSLSSVHPSAFIYLRQGPGFGCSPSAGRRWKQIRKLHISAEAWDFYGPSPGLDHLKMIEDFIRTFEAKLEKFTFTWLGRKGPCPLSLAADPLFAPPRSSKKLFNEVTSPMSPLPQPPARKPVVFERARYLSVRNATMNAPQVAHLVAAHRHSVREFDFENVALINSGNWDDALAPLMGTRSNGDRWARHSIGSPSPVGTPQLTSGESAASSSADDLTGPSAAVTAVSQELREEDLDDLDEGGAEVNTLYGSYDAPYDGYFEAEHGVEHDEHDFEHGPEHSIKHEEEEEDDGGLASDIEAARQASLAFNTQLKRRRITKQRRKKKHRSHDSQESHDGSHEDLRRQRSNSKESVQSYYETPKTPEPRYRPSQESIGRYEAPGAPVLRRQHSRRHRYSPSGSSELDLEAVPELSPPRHYPSRQRLFGERPSNGSLASSQRLFGEVGPAMEEPDLTSSPTDEAGSIDEYFRPVTPTGVVLPDMNISAPILNTQPSMPTLLQPTVYDPTAELCCEISAVQRDLEAEEAHRMLAEDAALRTSALKKAKEVVLSKLSKQFYPSGASKRSHGRGSADSNAVQHAAIGLRFREGLFGRNHPILSVQTDHRSLDSQSALVPILISR